MKVLQVMRDWTLIIAIVAGIAGYFIYAAIPALDGTHAIALSVVEFLQPLLIFCMLFLSFVKISLHDIRPCPWHWWLLLIQGGSFVALGCLLIALPHSSLRVILEGAMICLICPTATASAVITHKLGGSMAHITTYIILINLLASLLIPIMVPLIHANAALSVFDSAVLILGKVFPLLLMPLILAMIVRKLLPRLKERLCRYPDMAFYMWAVALALAIAVTVRSIMHTTVPVATQMWLVVVSLLTCVLQFAVGRRIGARYDDTITAGQALGQKNTVFAIWIGYTFFSPITALVGGFYSIWHNIVNSYQLYRHKEMAASKLAK